MCNTVDTGKINTFLLWVLYSYIRFMAIYRFAVTCKNFGKQNKEKNI